MAEKGRRRSRKSSVNIELIVPEEKDHAPTWLIQQLIIVSWLYRIVGQTHLFHGAMIAAWVNPPEVMLPRFRKAFLKVFKDSSREALLSPTNLQRLVLEIVGGHQVRGVALALSNCGGCTPR